MHRDVFVTISSLQSLWSLVVRLEHSLHVTSEGFKGLSGLLDLEVLEISVIPRGFMNCHNDLRVLGFCFCNALARFKKIRYLTLDLDHDRSQPMVMTVAEVIYPKHPPFRLVPLLDQRPGYCDRREYFFLNDGATPYGLDDVTIKNLRPSLVELLVDRITHRQ